MNEIVQNRLLTINDVLKFLNIKRTAFYTLRKTGKFPKPVFINDNQKGQRWSEEQVLNYIKKQTLI